MIACWMEKQHEPARLCIIHLLPHLVWVSATANVHSALSQINEGKAFKVNKHLHHGHRGSAILIPYTLRVIKTHPGEAGEVDRIF